MPYKGVVALISLAGFILIVFGASALRGSEANAVLWYPPLWGRHLAITLMLPAFILLSSSYIPSHIRDAVRHPMLTATIVWAAAHLLPMATCWPCCCSARFWLSPFTTAFRSRNAASDRKSRRGAGAATRRRGDGHSPVGRDLVRLHSVRASSFFCRRLNRPCPETVARATTVAPAAPSPAAAVSRCGRRSGRRYGRWRPASCPAGRSASMA